MRCTDKLRNIFTYKNVRAEHAADQSPSLSLSPPHSHPFPLRQRQKKKSAVGHSIFLCNCRDPANIPRFPSPLSSLSPLFVVSPHTSQVCAHIFADHRQRYTLFSLFVVVFFLLRSFLGCFLVFFVLFFFFWTRKGSVCVCVERVVVRFRSSVCLFVCFHFFFFSFVGSRQHNTSLSIRLPWFYPPFVRSKVWVVGVGG